MLSVTDFILNRIGEQKEILIYLHELLHSYPNVTSKIGWGLPVYYHHSYLCYLNPLKKGGVALEFTRGIAMNHSALDAKNRKQIAGIDFYHLTEIDEQLVRELIEAAIVLDENVKNASKSKR